MGRVRAVTNQDVARRAGVSPTTVSLVLNDRHGSNIPEETRERVRAAARDLGYRPNPHARSLRRGTSQAVGFVLSDVTNPGIAQAMRTVSRELARVGYGVMLLDSDQEDERTRQNILTLVDYRVSALVVSGARGADSAATRELIRLAAAGFPVIALTDPIPGGVAPSITADQERLGYLATRHLLEQGHRRIGFLAGQLHHPRDEPSDAPSLVRLRYHGYLRALTEADQPRDERLTVAFRDQSMSAREALGRLLAEPNPPTGIVVHNDVQAARAMKAALETGRRVPDDLAFVGIGNSPVCDLVHPGLTSVAQPLEDYATHLIKILRDILSGRDDWRGQAIVTTPYLVERGSSRRRASGAPPGPDADAPHRGGLA